MAHIRIMSVVYTMIPGSLIGYIATDGPPAEVNSKCRSQ